MAAGKHLYGIDKEETIAGTIPVSFAEWNKDIYWNCQECLLLQRNTWQCPK